MVMEVGTESDVLNRETNEVLDRLDRIHTTLVEQNARPGQFDLTQIRQATHVRMIPRRLVLSGTAAATVTITIGTRNYVFTFTANNLYYDVPFVYPIDRGVDIVAAITAGVLTAYLIYDPE